MTEDPVLFVVLTHPRSGSTLLIKAIRAHPAVRMYGELFQEELETRLAGIGAPHDVYASGEDGSRFLSETIFRDRDDPELSAVGFKLFYGQGREPGARTAWDYLLSRRDIRVVHLTRDDPLAAYVSLEEAEATGRWHLELDESAPPGPPVRLDPEACLAFLDELHSNRSWARHAFRMHPVLELSYERHLDRGFAAGLHDVQAFLGLPPMDLPALLQKQSDRPLEQRVTNLPEIRAALRNTVHATAPASGPSDARVRSRR